jgi:CubicO group peptidase (beta-lactamase class C family)
MNRAFIAAIVVFLATLSTTSIRAQSISASDAACVSAVENELLPYTVNGEPPPHMSLIERMAHDNVPAVSIAVVRDGRIAWAKAYGVVEDGGAPATVDTPFEAASISKAVLAIGVLRLVQDRRVSLDSDANQYLTSWKIPATAFTADRQVTIRELLDHTAGVTDTPSNDYAAAGQPIPTLVQVLEGHAPATNPPVTIESTPGIAWMYSDGGYDILAQLVQDVTREPFATYMQQTVLGPLGMTHSTYAQPLPSGLMAKVAKPYDINGNLYADGPYTFPSGEAGLWTTPSDLARWAIGVQDALAGKSPGILTRRMAKEMLTPQVQLPYLIMGDDESWGLGVEISGSRSGPYFTHDGHTQGYQCTVLAYNHGDGVAIMCNGDGGDSLEEYILCTIAYAYGWPDNQPVDRKITNLNPAQLGRYVGYYHTLPLSVQQITRDGDHLVRGGDDELTPMNARQFMADDGSIYTFNLDSAGNVTRLTMPQRGMEITGDKIDDTEVNRIQALREARAKSQTEDVAARAALTKILGELQQGKPDYGSMIPGIADVIRAHLPNIEATMEPYGPLKSITFLAAPSGVDNLYQANFENGYLYFRIALMDDGKIGFFSQRRGPH